MAWVFGAVSFGCGVGEGSVRASRQAAGVAVRLRGVLWGDGV